jgi:hypothetical protein
MPRGGSPPAAARAALLLLALCSPPAHAAVIRSTLPLVINVWPFLHATEAAWQAMDSKDSKTPALDAVEMVGREGGWGALTGGAVEPAAGGALTSLIGAGRPARVPGQGVLPELVSLSPSGVPGCGHARAAVLPAGAPPSILPL